MHRFSAAIFTALFFIVPAVSYSQTTPVWFTLLTPAQQSLTTNVGLPAETTYRIGDSENNKWSVPVTTTAAVTVVDYADGQDGRPADPDPGTPKEFDIQESATPQNVTVDGPSVTVPALPSAPVWFTLLTPAQQSLTTTVGLPAGTTYRIGDSENNKWSVPVTTTAAVTVVDYADGQDGRPADPDPGTPKEFDIQESATPQNVTVDGPSVTVPALPSAPVWFTLLTPAQQSLTTTVGLPAGTTYRIGDSENNKWSVPVTTTAAVTVVDYADGQDGRPADPDPGTPKEFDIQESATPQNVTVDGLSVTVPALPSAPVWFTLLTPAQQSLTTTVGLPAGTTYRIGDSENNKWSVPVTTTAAVTVVDYADGQDGRPADPDPGTAKEFDIQEQATPQNVSVNGQAVTVPGLSSSYACQLSGTPA